MAKIQLPTVKNCAINLQSFIREINFSLWPTQSLGQCHDMRTGTDITQVCIKLSSAHKGYDDGYRFFDF
jgi:hypothetical protein